MDTAVRSRLEFRPLAAPIRVGGIRGCYVGERLADRALVRHHAVDMYAVNPQRSVVSAAAQIGSSATQAASNSSLLMISYGWHRVGPRHSGLTGT
jgi:hypothetical protein